MTTSKTQHIAVATRTPAPSTANEIFDRIRARLTPNLSPAALDRMITPSTGDQSLNAWTISADFLARARAAAVLVGLVVREGEVHILLTQRTNGLRDHAGQIAFPGGKMDPDDASPAATALREAKEEVGLPTHAVEVLGYLDPYLTRTGFRIVPVVARLHPPFDLVLNAGEVAEAFEVPFAFLMNVANYELKQREWLGKARYFYAIEHGDRTIWGITAGILRVLCERLCL